MKTKAEVVAALDLLEAQMIAAFSDMTGGGQSREMSLAITKLEESLMWMRRAVERMFQ